MGSVSQLPDPDGAFKCWSGLPEQIYEPFKSRSKQFALFHDPEAQSLDGRPCPSPAGPQKKTAHRLSQTKTNASSIEQTVSDNLTCLAFRDFPKSVCR